MKKSLFYNSIFNIIYKIINAIYPLVTSAYIARVLMPDMIGEVMFAQTIVTYFTTVASLGIPTYGIKAIGSIQDSKKELNKRFTELFIINLSSTMFCFIGYLLFTYLFNGISNLKIMIIFGFLILLNIFNVDWLYQGLEDYRYIAVRNLFIKCFTLLLLFMLVRNSGDYLIYVIILVIGISGNYIFNAVNLKRFIQFDFHDINILQHFKPVLVLLFVILSTEVYTMLDSTMIGLWCSKADVAYYTNGIKMIRAIFAFLSATVAVNLPRLSYFYANNKMKDYQDLINKGLKISLFLSIPASLAVFLLSNPIVILLFGNSFKPTIMISKILSIFILLFSITYAAGQIVLISSNNENDILKATIIGALINFTLNVFLINTIGIIGAAIASLVAEFTVTFILLYNVSKITKFNITYRYIFTIMVSTVAMSVIIILVLKLFDSLLLQLFLSVIGGFIIYTLINLILKNDVIMEFLHYILYKKKIKK